MAAYNLRSHIVASEKNIFECTMFDESEESRVSGKKNGICMLKCHTMFFNEATKPGVLNLSVN